MLVTLLSNAFTTAMELQLLLRVNFILASTLSFRLKALLLTGCLIWTFYYKLVLIGHYRKQTRFSTNGNIINAIDLLFNFYFLTYTQQAASFELLSWRGDPIWLVVYTQALMVLGRSLFMDHGFMQKIVWIIVSAVQLLWILSQLSVQFGAEPNVWNWSKYLFSVVGLLCFVVDEEEKTQKVIRAIASGLSSVFLVTVLFYWMDMQERVRNFVGFLYMCMRCLICPATVALPEEEQPFQLLAIGLLEQVILYYEFDG
eukprot:CAMPEP_0115018726 /NCGR_PEP_ID=MMETSP0216-20121206/29007_1 /TAXON_ID=223996 /ORGANISM="Protocruzia adherens, Strain Boccale" /LENGTH=256 /DNA_ID=CAMNT_0002390035 /DNA_START=96 /DNA_END=862 /DNA_ORIENTATION=+